MKIHETIKLMNRLKFVNKPPTSIPEKPETSIKNVDSGTIIPCKYRYVYIWLTNGTSFWAWLTYVGRKYVSGWKWTGRIWVYFRIALRKIDSFVCY